MSRLESLEVRRLLSSSVSNGILQIIGPGGGAKIDVTLAGTKIKVNEHTGSIKSYDKSSVKGITADLKGGNDQISISDSITVPTTLNGGSGDDMLKGGGGKDNLLGGDGKDALIASA